ncbi:MAG: KpsF/GutQ family sugar-phosphate isomerase [Bryobacterales bacterium]
MSHPQPAFDRPTATPANPPAPDCTATARTVMEAEAQAIAEAAARLDGSFARAVDILAAHPGKVVVSGLGKSGNVARKIAATLASTGTPAIFLHPTDALHGDLGVYSHGDPTILVSKSGATAELLKLVPVLRELGSPLIGILGNMASLLSRQADLVLDASVRREADAGNLAPTSSAAAAMAIGDALALAVMTARGFTAEDFQRRHPAGHLGATLPLKVEDVMHTREEIAWVCSSDPLRRIVVAMTRSTLGAACVVSPERRLEGLITDGDLRRTLENCDDLSGLLAARIMTCRPVTISPAAPLREALRLMEDRPSQISVLPVVEADGTCAGLIRLHDIYLAGRTTSAR